MADLEARIAKFEDELNLVHQTLSALENQNSSLQASLDLIASEQSRLSHRLTESAGIADELRSLLLQIKSALEERKAEGETKISAVTEEPERERTAGMKRTNLRSAERRHQAAAGDSVQTLLAATITF